MTYEQALKELYDADKEMMEAHEKLKAARRPYEAAFPQAKSLVAGSEEDLRLQRLLENTNNAQKRFSEAFKACLDELRKGHRSE